MSAWFYECEQGETGPVDDAELRRLAASGVVRPNTLVKKGADGHWATADNVRGLFKQKQKVTSAQSATTGPPCAGTTSRPAAGHAADTQPPARTPPPLPATRPADSNPAPTPAPRAAPTSPSASPTPARQWYYMLEGFFSDEIVGPVSEETFLAEIHAGKIGPKVKVMSPTLTKGGWTQLQQFPSYMKEWKAGEAERERQKREETLERRRQREAKAHEKIAQKAKKLEQKRLQAAAAAAEQAQALTIWKQVPDLVSPNGVITVGQLLDHITKLPSGTKKEEIRVIRAYPDGTAGLGFLSVARQEQELKQLRSTALVYGPNNRSILQRVRTVDDGLRLEFGCVYAHLATQILRSELSVANDPEAKSLVQMFRQIEAHAEMGIGRDQYCQFVAQSSLGVKDFVALKSAEFPLFSSVLQGIFARHRDVVSIWAKGSGQSNMQFVGGGFGVKGALTGMAVSMALNSLVSASNRASESAMNDKICEQWAEASRLLRVAEHVMRSASGNDDIPMADLADSGSSGAGGASNQRPVPRIP